MDQTEIDQLNQKKTELEAVTADIRKRMNALDEEHHKVWTEYSGVCLKLEAPLVANFQGKLEDIPVDILRKSMTQGGYQSMEMFSAFTRYLTITYGITIADVFPSNNQYCMNFSPLIQCTRESNHQELDAEQLDRFVKGMEYIFSKTPSINPDPVIAEYKDLPKLGEEITDIHDLIAPYWMFFLGRNAFKGQFYGVVIKHQEQYLASIQVTRYHDSGIEPGDWVPITELIRLYYQEILDKEE